MFLASSLLRKQLCQLRHIHCKKKSFGQVLFPGSLSSSSSSIFVNIDVIVPQVDMKLASMELQQ